MQISQSFLMRPDDILLLEARAPAKTVPLTAGLCERDLASSNLIFFIFVGANSSYTIIIMVKQYLENVPRILSGTSQALRALLAP